MNECCGFFAISFEARTVHYAMICTVLYHAAVITSPLYITVSGTIHGSTVCVNHMFEDHTNESEKCIVFYTAAAYRSDECGAANLMHINALRNGLARQTHRLRDRVFNSIQTF